MTEKWKLDYLIDCIDQYIIARIEAQDKLDIIIKREILLKNLCEVFEINDEDD